MCKKDVTPVGVSYKLQDSRINTVVVAGIKWDDGSITTGEADAAGHTDILLVPQETLIKATNMAKISNLITGK